MRTAHGLALLPLLLLTVTSGAQARVWIVNQRHPHAADSLPAKSGLFVNRRHSETSGAPAATEKKPLATIGAAAERAMPGDTVLVHSGVYRERVAPENSGQPNRPVVYRAARGETVIVTGAEIWRPRWEAVKDHPDVWTAALDSSLFRQRSRLRALPDYNPFRVKRSVADTAEVLGQLSVDGEFLAQVAGREQLIRYPGTWTAERNGQALAVHFAPSPKPLDRRVIEITVRGRIFAPYKRGVSYIVVQSFVMERCANQYPENFYGRGGPPQAGALGCRGGNHWIIENNTIRFAGAVGIDCGVEGPEDADGLKQRQLWRAGHDIIRDNTISDNGAAGIVGENSSGTIITGNRIERNNRDGFFGMEGGGIKLHALTDGLIEANLIRDNGICGLWLDNGAARSRITRNVVVNNTGAGIFVELGQGPTLIDNNVVAYTTCGGGLAGDGIYSHDASGITVAHNLIYCNANFGVWAHIATDRIARMEDQCSNWRIVNNLILGNHRGTVSLAPVTPHSRNNRSDYNLLTGPFDLLSSETWGAPYDQPVFLVNVNKGRFPIDSVALRFGRALDSAKAPASQRPNLAAWASLPLLTLRQWQLLTGCDTHSRVPVVLRPNLSRYDLVMDFVISDAPALLGCTAVDGVDRDLFGAPMPAQGILPGPFQKLAIEPALSDTAAYATPFRGSFEKLRPTPERANRFLLWPIVPVNRDTYVKAWVASMAPDIKRLTEKNYPADAAGSAANPAPIPFKADTVIVDGDTADWSSVKHLAAPFEDKTAGALRLCWRPEGIYGAVVVPGGRSRPNPDAPWESDGIELFIQRDGGKPHERTAASAHYALLPVRRGDTCRVWSEQPSDTVKVVCRKKRDEAGCVLEFFLPAAVLQPATLNAGTVLGFNYAINARGEQIEQFFCHRGFDESWKKPFRWGAVRLMHK